MVFDLYILVLDLNIADDYLTKAGWIVDTESPHRIGNAKVETHQLSLISPDSQTKTVFFLASDWKSFLTTDPTLERLLLMADSTFERAPLTEGLLDKTLSFPPLSDLLDGLNKS